MNSNTPIELIELYQKPDRILKCKVNDGTTSHEYSDDSIYSIKLTSSFSNSAFSFGNTICKHIEIEFRNVDDVYFNDERFYVYIGISYGAYTLLGEFFISDVIKDDNKIKIEAYDAMYKLEKTYGLVYPDRTLKPKELLQDILSEAQLVLEDKSIIDSIFLSEYGDLSIPGFTSEKTIRQVLGCLVGIFGANAMITRDGKLRIFTYNTSPVIAFDTNNYFKFEWDGYEHKVSEIDWQNGNETITLGSTTNDTLRMVMDNYLVSSSMFDSLTEKALWEKTILERGTKSQYVGYSMEWQGCPCLDIGDVVKHTDKKGVERLIPILDYTLTYKGGLKCSMSAKGTSKLLNEYFKSGTIRGDIKRIENEVGDLYDKIDELQNNEDEDFPWIDGTNLVKNSGFNKQSKNTLNGERKNNKGVKYYGFKFIELFDWKRYGYVNMAQCAIATSEIGSIDITNEEIIINANKNNQKTILPIRILESTNSEGMSLSNRSHSDWVEMCSNTVFADNPPEHTKEVFHQIIYNRWKVGKQLKAGTKIYLSYRVKTYKTEKESYDSDDEWVKTDDIDCVIIEGDYANYSTLYQYELTNVKYKSYNFDATNKDFTTDNIKSWHKTLENWHVVKKIYTIEEDLNIISICIKFSNQDLAFIDNVTVYIEPLPDELLSNVSGDIDEVSQNVIEVEDQVDTNTTDIVNLQENKQDTPKVYSSYDFVESGKCADIATDGNIHITEQNRTNIFMPYYVGNPDTTKNKIYIDIDYSSYNLDDNYYFILLIKDIPHSQSFVDYAGNPIASLNSYSWKANTLYYLLKDSYNFDDKTWHYKVVPVNSQEVDLSNYYDKDEIDNKLTKYYTKEDVYSQEQISNILDDYYTSEQIDNKFNNLSDSFQTRIVEIIDGENVLGAYGKTTYNNSDTDIAMTINHKRDYASAIGYQTPEGSQYGLGSYVIFDKYNKLKRTHGDEYSIEYRQPTIFNENVKFLGKIEGSITQTDCYTKAEVDNKLNEKSDKCKKITFLSTGFNSNELAITHNLATTGIDCVVINENNRRELCKLTIVDENNIKITNDRAFNGAIIISKI